jgi:hypothetical protein
MPNIRVFPGAGAPNPMTIVGTQRKYTFTAGSFLDVPDFDAQMLAHAGHIIGASRSGSVGPTSGRPSAPGRGDQYTDTTVGAIIIFNGSSWVNSTTGAVV